MISKTPELIIEPGSTKISTVWAFLKALPRTPDLHYYAHEFGTEEWYQGREPGVYLDKVADMPGDLYLIESSKTLFVVLDIHYIAVVTGELHQLHLNALKGRFKCSLITCSQ